MSDKRPAAVARALEIVSATEWSGDMRVNMTRIIGAGKVLSKRLEETEAEIERLRESLRLITRKYCRHVRACPQSWEAWFQQVPPGPCTCGLEAAVKEIIQNEGKDNATQP